MTARLSDNEFEQQCVAYSKQRLADGSQQANDEYLEALNATKYQILTGYNGNDATYSDVTYNILTGYFGDSNIPTASGTAVQTTGVAANKQYIVTDNQGRILVNEKIANAFKNSKGDYNKFLEQVGAADYPGTLGYTQIAGTPSQQEVHEAWDRYLVAVGKGVNASDSLHILGFAYNREATREDFSTSTKLSGDYVDFATYETKSIQSQTPGAENEDIYLNIDTKLNASDPTLGDDYYYVKNYEVIAVPHEREDGSIFYLPAYKTEAQQGTEDYIELVDYFKDDLGNDLEVFRLEPDPTDPTKDIVVCNFLYDESTGVFTYDKGTGSTPIVLKKYINPTNTSDKISDLTDDYRTEVSVVPTSFSPRIQTEQHTLFYEGTTPEHRELYDYAMAVSRKFAASPVDSAKMVYDPGRLNYYQNIYSQMIRKGYTTYADMLKTGYMAATESDEKVAYQNENWLITQLKRGKLNISFYSALEKGFVATTLDDDESICEKEDKTKIAIAEQVYKNKMDHLEAEDKQFDLTLNKLEAEHQALQTEYDAVAKVISKNVEKSFGIFNA